MIRKVYPQILTKPVVLIYLLPIVILIPFIVLYGFRVPVMDEWQIAVIFEKIAMGKAGLIDFMEIYNDHRYFFLRLIVVPLAFLSGWNKIYEMLISVLFAIANAIFIVKISQQQNPKNFSSKYFHIINGLSCLILFSIVQYQNWLWGLQLGVFLVNLCITIALFILCLNQKFCERKRLLFAALPIIIASFTMAQGLISWLAILPSVFFLTGKNFKLGLKYVLIWFGLFGITTIIYSLGYHSDNPTRFNIAFLLEHPLFWWQFLFILLGAPLAQYSAQLANVLGMIVFFSFASSIIRGWQTRGLEFLQTIAPWISLGLFALLFATITTFGRAEPALSLNQGLDFALGSRYTTNSLLLWIAVLQIGLYFVSQNLNINRWKWKLSSVAIMIIFLTSINTIYAIKEAKNYRNFWKSTQDCLKVIQVLDDRVPMCWNRFKILESHDIIRQRTRILNNLGMINSPDLKFTDRKTNDGSFVWDNSQNVFPLSHNNGWIMLKGNLKINAPFPKTNSPYLFILSRENQPSLISFVETDPTLLTHRKQLRFQIAVPTLVFNLYQKTPIQAWIQDTNTPELIALAGETQITVTPDNIPNPRFNRQPQQVYGYITDTPNRLILNPTDIFSVDGWAGFGDRDKQPDRVFFSYGDEKFFFAQTEINLDTPHVVQHFKSDRYRRSGWRTELSAQDLPPGETSIRAWVYEPDAGEFVTLNNVFSVVVQAKDVSRSR